MKRIDLDNGDYIIIADKQPEKKEKYTNDDVALTGLAIFTVGALFGAGFLYGLALIANEIKQNKPNEPEGGRNEKL